MINLDSLSPELFKKLGRQFNEGDLIFKQGESGKTMYIVAEGTARVFYNTGNVDHLVSIVGPGEIIGEKAILDEKPYQRTFSVQAKSDLTLLEIDAKHYKLLQTKYPDINILMLRLVLERLDKANEMIGILQVTDALERFIQYVLYYHRHHQRRMGADNVIPMTASEIRYAINLEKPFVEGCLKDLVKQKVITEVNAGFLLKDENALHNYAPKLREKMAA